MARKALIHKNTNQTTNNGGVLSPKLPTAGTLQKGEIAVNYKDGYETLSIENDQGEVVPFASLEQIMSYVDNSLPDLELSSNYSTSDLENEDLQLAKGDSYEEAFSKLEKAILDDEEIVATSLVELNDRINDCTSQIPETVLSEQYAPSTDSNEDLFLEAGDTYEEAFSKLEKSINDNEQITSAALSDLDSRIPTKTSDLDNDSLPSQDNILFPNFNNLTPINTIEFDVSATSYYKLFERSNTGVSNLKDVNEIVKFRVTVTGTNIYSESDVIFIMPQALIYPTILGYNRTLSNSAGTTGLMYIRCCYPKTLNNNYPWMGELRVYNSTARHIKIEIFESPENVTWITSKTNTTYNSTYQGSQEAQFYTRRGFISSGVSWMAGDVQGTCTSAAYINSYLDIWVGGTLPLTGEALTTNSLIYVSGGKLYKATNKTMPIEPFVGIIKTGTSYNAEVTPSYAYLQQKNSWTALTGDSALVIPTLTRGDQVYLRCTMNNGNIYSDGTLSTTMDAGYTWVHIGTAQSATAINLDTCGKFFITLASDGKITHINGKAIQSSSGGGGDVNIIETVKVNGTALTPDANKAVDITVPAAITESTVSGWGFTKNTGTYSKPSGGIPKSDLADSVQTSLGKADTALQSFTESDPTVPSHVKEITTTDISNWNNKLSSAPVTSVNGQTGAVSLTIPSAVTESTVSGWGFTKNSGTVTGVKMNGTTNNPTSGVVDLGTVLTSFTETDPTVPSWAKATNKPTYTAAEVGALPDTYTPPVTSVNGQTGAVSLSIPAAVTESTVSGWGFTKNAGTITGITMNGSSKGTSGVVNLGTVLTSHQTLKTINNESIVGTGNLTVPGLPTVTSSDNGKVLQVVNGAWSLVMPTAIYSGTSTPSNSVGNDGDLYLQTS